MRVDAVVDKHELARVWAEEDPSIRIGKGGIDAGVVEEIKRLFKRKKLMKVRFLPSTRSLGKLDVLATDLATKTGSAVCGRRGSVVVLARKSRRARE